MRFNSTAKIIHTRTYYNALTYSQVLRALVFKYKWHTGNVLPWQTLLNLKNGQNLSPVMYNVITITDAKA